MAIVESMKEGIERYNDLTKSREESLFDRITGTVYNSAKDSITSGAFSYVRDSPFAPASYLYAFGRGALGDSVDIRLKVGELYVTGVDGEHFAESAEIPLSEYDTSNRLVDHVFRTAGGPYAMMKNYKGERGSDYADYTVDRKVFEDMITSATIRRKAMNYRKELLEGKTITIRPDGFTLSDFAPNTLTALYYMAWGSIYNKLVESRIARFFGSEQATTEKQLDYAINFADSVLSLYDMKGYERPVNGKLGQPMMS